MAENDTNNETVEVSREVFDDTVRILKDVERILSGATSYSRADTVRRYREKLEDEDAPD